jgi:hypothetical protein
MVLNLTKSLEACTKQSLKDDSLKSALSPLSPNQSALFNLLTADDFEVHGPKVGIPCGPSTWSNRPPVSGGSMSDKSLLHFLCSGTLRPT